MSSKGCYYEWVLVGFEYMLGQNPHYSTNQRLDYLHRALQRRLRLYESQDEEGKPGGVQ